MLTRFAFCLCISLLGTGCAAQYFTLLESYRNAPICCKSISEFSFESIQIGDKKGFYFKEDSPAYMFKTGKSYFRAFVLPQSSYPYQVSVGSCILAGFDPDYELLSYVFFPQLLILNENYEVVRSSYPVDFRAREVLSTDIDQIESILEPYCSGHMVAGKIPFTTEDMSEKYLIILTTNDLLKAKTSFLAWMTETTEIDGYWVPTRFYKEEYSALHSPVGLIMLSVLDLD
jgi:hypothetical protein